MANSVAYRELPRVWTQIRTPSVARRRALSWGLVVLDTLALTAAFGLAYFLRFRSVWLPYHSSFSFDFYTRVVFWAIPTWLVVFAAYRLYDIRHLFGGTDEYARVASACTFGMMMLVAYSFFDSDRTSISRGWLLISWVLSLTTAEATRFLARRLVYHLRKKGHLTSRVVIVGTNGEGRAIARQFRAVPKAGLQVVGFVDDSLPLGAAVLDDLKVLGRSADLDRLIQAHGIEELLIATPSLPRGQLLDLFQRFGARDDVDLRLSSGLFEILTTGVHVKEIQRVPLVSFDKVRITGLNLILKTALDYGLALIILTLSWPLLAIISAAIVLDSSGPVFYRRRVLGRGDRPFDAFKFRTMVSNADQMLAEDPQMMAAYKTGFKLKRDPRVTRLGAFLRKYSLDELPQVFNVLRGEMSLVGPRMITPEEAEQYGQWRLNLLTVKPGLTGLWQVSGRSDLSHEQRIRLDMHYIRNCNLWLDLHLLFRTVPAVLKGRGAY
jgi:exopolysaccharide biosynthesis polyprenyl glycosylphosphotransferase